MDDIVIDVINGREDSFIIFDKHRGLTRQQYNSVCNLFDEVVLLCSNNTTFRLLVTGKHKDFVINYIKKQYSRNIVQNDDDLVFIRAKANLLGTNNIKASDVFDILYKLSTKMKIKFELSSTSVIKRERCVFIYDRISSDDKLDLYGNEYENILRTVNYLLEVKPKSTKDFDGIFENRFGNKTSFNELYRNILSRMRGIFSYDYDYFDLTVFNGGFRAWVYNYKTYYGKEVQIKGSNLDNKSVIYAFGNFGDRGYNGERYVEHIDITGEKKIMRVYSNGKYTWY